MFGILFLAFTTIPILEIYLLFQAADVIGGFNTIAVVIVTGFLGAWAAKSQGYQIIAKLQKDMGEGRLPADQMIEGLFVLVGGVLLLTPGFFTDFLGLSMVFPITRKIYIALGKKWIQNQVKKGTMNVYYHSSSTYEKPHQSSRPQHPDIIDVEAKNISED